MLAAGGAQALLKGSQVVPGRRAVVAGTGPFLLPVATGLAEAGVEVVAVCEAGSLGGWARSPLGTAAVPSKSVEAARYAAALARHRIPFHTRTAVTEVHGDDAVSAVTLSRLDRAGRVRAGVRPRRVEADVVALGWGFTPSLDLFTTLGARLRVDTDESLVVEVDAGQRTDVPGVYAAGEVTGVGGALLALAEGEARRAQRGVRRGTPGRRAPGARPAPHGGARAPVRRSDAPGAPRAPVLGDLAAPRHGRLPLRGGHLRHLVRGARRARCGRRPHAQACSPVPAWAGARAGSAASRPPGSPPAIGRSPWTTWPRPAGATSPYPCRWGSLADS
ncbi:FAD-dependent oxidoreductase [Nocardioides convexus]|uniref:FAD-dependent oxidoreductase n=1 Tax=Nocardioides convexus TaxID=2712224 RepID=UPI0024189111|nr:FAD-dependent oxidoreductase [Nocardioides convexus]